MESLAAAAAVIVLPAMVFGPVALILTFFKRRGFGIAALVLVVASAPSNIFLLASGISPGATWVGVLGAATSAFAVAATIRLRRNHKAGPAGAEQSN